MKKFLVACAIFGGLTLAAGHQAHGQDYRAFGGWYGPACSNRCQPCNGCNSGYAYNPSFYEHPWFYYPRYSTRAYGYPGQVPHYGAPIGFYGRNQYAW